MVGTMKNIQSTISSLYVQKNRQTKKNLHFYRCTFLKPRNLEREINQLSAKFFSTKCLFKYFYPSTTIVPAMKKSFIALALGESCTSLPLLMLAVSAASEKDPMDFLSFFFFF
jgi:hypothetical protein